MVHYACMSILLCSRLSMRRLSIKAIRCPIDAARWRLRRRQSRDVLGARSCPSSSVRTLTIYGRHRAHCLSRHLCAASRHHHYLVKKRRQRFGVILRMSNTNVCVCRVRHGRAAVLCARLVVRLRRHRRRRSRRLSKTRLLCPLLRHRLRRSCRRRRAFALPVPLQR